MIDWPNLIAGFILGVIASLAFLLWDRRHERRKEKDEARSEWLSAASEIDLVLWKSETTSGTLHTVVTRLPLERWRRLLGPDDFRALERVQNAYAGVELWSPRAAEDEAAMQRFVQAADELRAARTEFVNRVRMQKATDYLRVVGDEFRQATLGEYRQHPIETWKRVRHNRRVHRERQSDVQ